VRSIKLVADLHIHSVGSGHAYSTITEIAAAARDKGLAMVAVTDHGPAMPDGPHPYYFANQRVWPREIDGVRILRGIEANIINEKGELDLEEFYLKRLEIVLAGFHSHCTPSGDVKTYTKAMLSAMENPYVDIIVHPGNPEFPVDYDIIIKTAAKKGIPLEINNSSFCGSRRGSIDNCRSIAKMIAKSGGLIVIGSDAHFACDVGRFEQALEAVKEAGIKEEQILNTSVEKILAYLGRKKYLVTSDQ
jgi:putative hydrolase